MLRLYFIAFLLAGCSVFSFKLQNGDDDCCDTKTVGDVTYELVGEMDTSSYGCVSNCVYQLMGGNGISSFCFKTGSLPVACKDDALRTTTRTPTWTTMCATCDCDCDYCCDHCSHCCCDYTPQTTVSTEAYTVSP